MVDLDVILPPYLSACLVFSAFHFENKDPITHPSLPISHLENKALPFLRSEGKDNGSSGCGSQREESKGPSLTALRGQEVGVGVRRVTRPWAVGIDVFFLAGPAPSVGLVSGLKREVIVIITTAGSEPTSLVVTMC